MRRYAQARATSWLAALLFILTVRLCTAGENLDTERLLTDIIEQSLVHGGSALPHQTWGVLPIIGYSPEKGPNVGVKFTDRDATSARMTFDLEGNYALKRQQHLSLGMVAPHFFDDWLILAFQGSYDFDPTREFFGLGNNSVGSDELSTNEDQQLTLLGTIALRPIPRFILAFSGGYSDVRIAKGRLQNDTPSTASLFPELVGIDGGQTNPLAFSVVYTNREDLTRPTRGWHVIAKIQHVNHALGNDFQYTRYIADGSYLYPLLTRRQVLGLRIAGEYIDSKRRQLPFYEFAPLGGNDDLRGFFFRRFLGHARAMINGEYRLKLLDFDFFKIWRVRIDGVAFGDMGRVFITDSDLQSDYGATTQPIPASFDHFRYSYGGGTRIALGEAILARIDVGFSNEETGLVYLTFGHTF